ncbi:Crossover junction endonuclease EME1 [Liparis tanakae]|uniref:Crossover junction endonuclease EME1 n=1 Tax=Liparis tanakae TaxID=230148 RepID=A0A4Z2FMJ3_9TELE|nr:Crossover junction endonuclease EME1 [Liparis tanakae]
MCSYSDSTSDLDEELPVFDFLQAGRRRASPSRVEASAAKGDAAGGGGTGAAVVLMISSDSDDSAPYVPLAQRLEQRRRKAISPTSSSSSSSYAAAGNGEDGERCPPSNLPHLNGPAGSDWLLGLRQARTASCDASPVRRKAAGRGQQKDKEERERQKAERKALAEAAKALRPEECIKRMVVAVDPALLQLEGGGVLLASVQALGCSCAVEKQPVPRSVSWMRKAAGAQPGGGGGGVPEAHVVMQVTVDDFVTLVHGYVQVQK